MSHIRPETNAQNIFNCRKSIGDDFEIEICRIVNTDTKVGEDRSRLEVKTDARNTEKANFKRVTLPQITEQQMLWWLLVGELAGEIHGLVSKLICSSPRTRSVGEEEPTAQAAGRGSRRPDLPWRFRQLSGVT